MGTSKTTKANSRPKPPEELEGEALLEWGRISDELEALGRLSAADRAIMLLHCQTWAAHAAATKHVGKYGPVIKWPNGVPGPSPFYKVQKETAATLRGTLADLGLTPAARNFDRDQPADAGDLDF